MKIIIQKFGGTSVSTHEVRLKVAQKIINAKRSGFQPVVVVSAMGRAGEPYATDTLIKLLYEICKDTHPREMDLLVSCGEIISAVVMSNTLKSKGYDAKAFTGGQAGIITNKQHMEADIIEIKPEKVIETIESGRIPVVAGFQGMSLEGDFTTLGRGGSDVTALALGEALSANCVEIYTDVDGIMTADPRIVPNASVLKHINYSDVLELASKGAKVIHPHAIEYAMRSNIPIFIKNTMNNQPGTIISMDYKDSLLNYGQISSRVVTSVAHITGRIQIIIKGSDAHMNNRIISQLADNHISIDLINVFPDHMVFTAEESKQEKIEEIVKQNNCEYDLILNCSKISAVGSRMRGVPGVMSRIVKALVKENIEILQTSDSHTTISCLVRREDTTKAVIALHEEFELYK